MNDIVKPLKTEWNAKVLSKQLLNDPDALVGTVRHPFSAVDIDLRMETIAIERAVYQIGQSFEPDVVRICLPKSIRNNELAGLLTSGEFSDLLREIDEDLEAVIDGTGAAHRIVAEIEAHLNCKFVKEKMQ